MILASTHDGGDVSSLVGLWTSIHHGIYIPWSAATTASPPHNCRSNLRKSFPERAGHSHDVRGFAGGSDSMIVFARSSLEN